MCRARARIRLHLVIGRRHRAPGQQLCLGLVAADADGQLGRTDATTRQIRKETLHGTVLERVEADRAEPAALAQQVPGGWERAVERVELAVDRDSERLEAALRRMPPAKAV